MSFRRILIAVDAGPAAAQAAVVGLDLARSLAGEVAFVHTIDSSLGNAPDTGESAARLMDLAEQDGKSLLAECRQRAALQPPPLEFLPVGKPGAEIVKAATAWLADVIVIGSHGRGGVTRLIAGSVAETVMRHAPCPVLVVRSHS